jgi:tetratricopeptide (TPR) repeat protein
MDQAEQTLGTAERLVQSVLVTQPSNRTAVLRLAQISHDRMVLARLGGRPEEALTLARKSAQLLEKFHAGESDKEEASAVLTTYLNVADQFNHEDQYDEALRLCSRGTEIARLFNSRTYAGDLLWVSADVYRIQGDFEKALRDIRESLKSLGPSPAHPAAANFALALIKEGRILGEDGAVSLERSEEAARSLDRAFQMEDELVHKDALDQGARGRLAMAGISLADIMRHTDAHRALEIYDHTLQHLAEIKGNASFRTYEVSVLAGSSYALRRLGHPAEARRRLDGALERLRQLKLYPAEKIEVEEVHLVLSALADHEAETGQVERAIEIYHDLLDRLQAEPDAGLNDAVVLSNFWRSLASLHRRAGHADTARALDAKRLDLWRRWNRKLPNNPFVLRQIAAKPVV